MTRERDPFRIPRVSWKMALAAGLASIDIHANGGILSLASSRLRSALSGLRLSD